MSTRNLPASALSLSHIRAARQRGDPLAPLPAHARSKPDHPPAHEKRAYPTELSNSKWVAMIGYSGTGVLLLSRWIGGSPSCASFNFSRRRECGEAELLFD